MTQYGLRGDLTPLYSTKGSESCLIGGRWRVHQAIRMASVVNPLREVPFAGRKEPTAFTFLQGLRHDSTTTTPPRPRATPSEKLVSAPSLERGISRWRLSFPGVRMWDEGVNEAGWINTSLGLRGAYGGFDIENTLHGLDTHIHILHK